MCCSRTDRMMQQLRLLLNEVAESQYWNWSTLVFARWTISFVWCSLVIGSIIFAFIFWHDIFLRVQLLRNKSSLSIIGKKPKIPETQHNQNFNNYIECFFNILTQDKKYEIIKSTQIINKCVLIEDKNIFYWSLCLNLFHHS